VKASKKKAAQEGEEKGFQDTPRGWAGRWAKEFETTRKDERFREWQDLADKIEKRFRDERDSKSAKQKRLNLFTSNQQMQRAMMYGRPPGVSVERKFADAADDLGRVACEMEERLLNCENERDGDTFAEAVGLSLQDYQLAGLGIARVRYEFETETVAATEAIIEPVTGRVLVEAIEAHERKVNEDAPVDWVHWKEFLWSKSKVPHRVWWQAYLYEMPREKVEEKFGKEIADAIPYGKKAGRGDKDKDTQESDACVWEIWNKRTKSVFFYVEGHHACLTPVGLDADSILPNGSVRDPLQLDGFWPSPRPMLANSTTSTMVPVPEFYLAQDLYLEVDNLTTRIDLLVDAVKVAGAYDSTAKALEQLLKTKGNILVPVDNWAMEAEKGGPVGRIDWWPLEQVTTAILSLKEQRRESMDLIFQVTGQSDLIRGQQAQNGTPGEAKIKAKSASIRMQQQQEEFARFCSDLQRLRAQVIAKHFDTQTIIERSNILMTPDARYAQEAAEFIKSKLASYRIEVKPESLAMADIAASRQEGLELLGGLTAFVDSMARVVPAMPGIQKHMWKMLQVALAPLKGTSGMETILDDAIKETEQQQEQQAAQPPQPSPEQMKLQAVQMKGQQDMQKEQVKHQQKLVEISAEVQADAQREQTQAMWNTRESAAKAQISAANRAMQPQPVVPRRIR
jgi:hypothetical protein